MTKTTFLNYTTIDYLNEKDMEQALIRSQVQRIKHYPKLKELLNFAIKDFSSESARTILN